MQITDVLRQIQESIENPGFTMADFQAKAQFFEALSQLPDISDDLRFHSLERMSHFSALAYEVASRK